MAHISIPELMERTQDEIKKGIYKKYLNKYPLLAYIKIETTAGMVYSYRTKLGIAGEIGTRELNGEFNQGDASVTKIETVSTVLLNEVRHVDRAAEAYGGNLTTAGLLAEELEDIAECLGYSIQKLFLNASKSNGDKFNGAFALATAGGFVESEAVTITPENVIAFLATLQSKAVGDNGDKIMVMAEPTYTFIQTCLHKAGYEYAQATNDFGHKYASFGGSLLLPITDNTLAIRNSSTGNPEVTTNCVIPTTHIACIDMSTSGVTGATAPEGAVYRIKTLKDCKTEEHPTADVEQLFTVVDHRGGKSIALATNVTAALTYK